MSRRPVVAVDLRALVPESTGIGVYTRELLAALLERGRLDFLGLAHREPLGAAGLVERGLRIEHQRAPLGVAWQQLVLPRYLKRLEARGEVDLFWSPLQTLPLACPVPAVVSVHDLTVLLLPDTHRAKVRWSQIPFLEPSLERARRVVAVSQATARDLEQQFPGAFFGEPDKLRVIPHGVAPGFRPAEEAERAAIRNELGCPGGYLLYVGTLEPRKNVSAVLDAWLALRDDDAESTPPLVLAGGYGWRSKGLLRRIERVRRELEREGAEGAPGPGLHLLGRVDDATLGRLYRGATAFVYPSFYEGFGLPVAEAMASGVPVVTSDRSSLPEVVGDAGLTVRPEDPSLLAGALRHLLEEPSRQSELARRGLERARTFRWETAAAAMEEVLLEAIEDG